MKVKFYQLLVPFLMVFLVSLVSGCSKQSNQQAETEQHPLNMLRQDVGSEAPTLDPQLVEDTASNRISYDLFAGLLDFDQQNNPIPGMASSWQISQDGKIYTFDLRKDLKFSNGSPITAADFVYSWQRLVNPQTASPYNFLLTSIKNASAIIQNKLPASELGVRATDNYTFVVELAYPDSLFLQEILTINAAVVSKKAIEKYGKAWTSPGKIITSGAYMLKEHVVNGYILVVKNPYYYDAKNVAIDQVKYLPYEDKNTTIPSYKSGGLDITWQSIPVDQYDEIKKQYSSQVHTVLQEAVYYYDFNMKDAKFADNINLRKALSMAVDRKALSDEVLKQKQPPLYSVVTATIENGAYKSIVYDWATWPRAKQIEKAKEYMAKAGYNQQNPLTVEISYNTNDLHKRVALAVSAMWKSVFGSTIKVSLQNGEWKTFIQSRHKGDYEVARDGWVADYNGVTSYTNLYYCGNEQNNAHYCNSKFNELVDKAAIEMNPELRIKYLQQALQYPLDDYATIPLFQYSYQQLIKPHVKGYNPDNNYLEHIQTKWMSLVK
jgi:oligopeptide transport system substrate-binding protein